MLLTLCAIVFVDLLGFTLILPSLPFYVAELGGGGIWLGVLMTGYSLAQALFAPVLGRLADRYGRRRLLLLSLAGSALSLPAMGFAGSLWLLLAARVVAGICGGSIGVAQALAVDVTPPENRAKAMGQIGAAIGLAFTIGPGLGALSGSLGFATVASIAAGLAAANLIVAWQTLPHTPPRIRRTTVATGPRPWALLIAGFTGMAAFVGMETTIAFLAADRFAAGPGFVGLLLCLAGLAMTIVQGTGIGPAVRRWGERRVAIVGALLMAVGLISLPFVVQPVFVGAVVVLSVGNGLVTATVASMLAAAGPPESLGARLGEGQAAASAARVAGPLGSGALFDLTAWLPYLLGAALSAVTAVAATRKEMASPLRHRSARRPPPH